MPTANFPGAATTFGKEGYHKVGDLLTGTLQTTLTGASTTVQIDAALAAEMDTGGIDANFMLLVDDIEQIFCSTRSGQTCTIAAGGRGAGNPPTPVADRTAGALIEVVFSSTYLERIRLELAAVIAEIGITGSQNFLRVDGTEAMLAALDMGGFAITNVGNVDGVDISAHAAASSGVHGVTGSVVGTTDTQALTNKTLDDDTNVIRATKLDTTGAAVVIGGAAPPTAGQVLIASSATVAGWETLDSADISDFTEAAQDAVGAMLTDSTTINLTYVDGTPALTADVIADSIDNTLLANMAAATVKGRASGAGTGDPVDLTAAQLITILLAADGAGSLLDADFLDGQNLVSGATTANSVAGRDANGRIQGANAATGTDLVTYQQTPGLGAAVALMPWTEVTGTSQSMAVNNGYIANNAGLVTLTLPDTAAVGSILRIVGKGAGGWRIAQNASEQIIWNEGGVDGTNETTVGTGGRIDSTDDYDAIELVCITANTTWAVLSAKGNPSLV